MKNVVLVLAAALMASTCYGRDTVLAQQYNNLARGERDNQRAAERRGDFAAAQQHKATADQLTAASHIANSPGFQPGMIALPSPVLSVGLPPNGVITVPVPVPVYVPTVHHQVYGGNYGGNYRNGNNNLRQFNNNLQQVNRTVNTIRNISRNFR